MRNSVLIILGAVLLNVYEGAGFSLWDFRGEIDYDSYDYDPFANDYEYNVSSDFSGGGGTGVFDWFPSGSSGGGSSGDDSSNADSDSDRSSESQNYEDEVQSYGKNNLECLYTFSFT